MTDAFVWRPIDSAPKDGTKIIVTGFYCCGTELIEKAHFDAELGKFVAYSQEFYDYEAIDPVLWFPIPEKPQLDEKSHG